MMHKIDGSERNLDETCGCESGCCHKRIPVRLLQCCATPGGALFLLSFSAFLQGFIVNGLIKASITTLETRFQLLNSEAGLIASSYDIASCLTLLFVTYVGGRGRKPLWLGWGVVLIGVGGLLFSLPHFVAPSHKITIIPDLCVDNGTSKVECTDTSLRSNRFFFNLAQFIMGIGAAPLYTLGATYLDENVEQAKSSMYHGVFYSFSIVGPGAGYLVAGYYLTIYTYVGVDPGISDDNPQFIGAWWLPFVIVGSITFFFGFPLLLLPRQLPGTEEVRKNRQKEMFKDNLATNLKSDEDFGIKLKDFPKSVLILSRNFTYISLSIAGATDVMLASSLATFSPKIIQSLFKYTPSQSAFILGTIAILGGAGGQFVGGLVISKSKMSVRGILKLCLVSSIVTFLFFLVFLLTCPDVNLIISLVAAMLAEFSLVIPLFSATKDFAGANVAYLDKKLEVGQINAECNQICGCETDIFDPVCGTDGVTYYSSCYAGCRGMANDTLTMCSCIMKSDDNSSMSEATKGVCSGEECAKVWRYIFLGSLFAAMFLIFGVGIPGLQATLRIVLFSQRSFAVGVQWLLFRALGTIPGPLIFGAVLDKACVILGSSCGQQGSCNVYSNSQITKYIAILVLLLKGTGILCYIAAFKSYNMTNPSTSMKEIILEDRVKPDNLSGSQSTGNTFENPAYVHDVEDKLVDQ